MATYVNDLRLKEISTGDESGTWGTSTNTNLELIGEAFSFGTEAITTNADTHTTTIADGATDPGRSMFLKYTGTLDSTCTITIGPNTVSKLWFIENATSGSQDIIIKQGSGATVTIVNGQTKAIYSDGAGASGAMVDAFQDLSVPDLFVDDDLTFTSDSAVITFGADGDTTLTHTDGSGLTLNSTNKIMFNDASQFIQGSSATVLALGATDEIDLTATAIDVNGTMDVSGAITSSAGATITVADNSNNLTLTSTDGDANSGPKLDLYRNSTGPADGDLLGRINFRGRNDNSQDVDYAAWMSRISDASDGSEDGILRADVIAAGAIVDVLTLYGTEVVVNESSADVDFRVESDNSTHALFVQGSDGNVGIGTSSPDALMRVNGTAKIGEGAASNTAKLMVNTASGVAAGIQLFQDGTESWIIQNPASTTALTFSNSGTERLRIDGSGNVSVSSSAGLIENAVGVFMLPAGELRVKDSTEDGTAQISIYNNNVTSDAEQFFVGNNLADVDIGNKRGALKFFANSVTERMRIASDGKVLIGSTGTSFNERLTVNSNSAPYSAHLFAGSGATAPLICRNANGVSGTRSQIIFYYDASAVGSITSTSSATALVTSSDQRLKENIVDADDAGSKIDVMQVRKFDWKADGSHQEYGFVAQELEPVFSHAVHTAEDDMQTKGVDYASLVPMLVKEIQSLRARVNALETE